MPNGWKKNVDGLGRRVSEGGARWNFCNCCSCTVAVACAKAGDWGDGDIGILGDGGGISWRLRNTGGFGHQFAACRSGMKAVDLPGGACGRRANGNRGQNKPNGNRKGKGNGNRKGKNFRARDGWRSAVDQIEVLDTRGSREASGGEVYSIASTSSAAPRGQRFDAAPVEANRIQEEEASCRRRAALLFNMIEPNDLARSG